MLGHNNYRIVDKLSNEAKKILGRNAREIWEARTGRMAGWDGMQIHHRIPLEWSHIFPDSDPNKLSNLIGIDPRIHAQITTGWASWKKTLDGRIPTQEEILMQANFIDEVFGDAFVFIK